MERNLPVLQTKKKRNYRDHMYTFGEMMIVRMMSSVSNPWYIGNNVTPTDCLEDQSATIQKSIVLTESHL